MIPSQEKHLRQEVIALFDKAALKAFYSLRPGRVLWTFAHIWTGIIVALALAAWVWRSDGWGAKLLIPLIVFYIGTRINAIAVQVHEAAHQLLFSKRRTNDLFCDLFGAYWVLNDVGSYRRVHLIHHTDLHLASDPDRELYELSPGAGRPTLVRALLQDVFWVTAVRRILSYLKVPGRGEAEASGASKLHLLAKLGCQGLLGGAAVLSFGGWQGPLFYLVFWLLPLFSVFPAIIRLRIVTEHFSPLLHEASGRPFICRTTCTAPLEIYLFGCDMEHHFEHHLFPTIPHPQLARLHAALVERQFFQGHPPDEDHLSAGYLWFWCRLFRGQGRPSSTPDPVLN